MAKTPPAAESPPANGQSPFAEAREERLMSRSIMVSIGPPRGSHTPLRMRDPG